MDNDFVSEVLEAEQSVQQTFSDKWDNAYENQKFASLRQWTEKEINKHKKQGRTPFVMDKLIHPITVLMGSQRDTRFDISFLEQEASDYSRAEVLNATWKYFAQQNHFIFTESDIFQDAIIAGYGVFDCYTDYKKNPLGNLVVKRLPFDQVLWDGNSRQYDLSDAYWMSGMDFVRRDELKRYYPDRADLIDVAGLDNSIYAAKKIDADLWFLPDKNLIGIRKFYERTWVKKFFIWQVGTPIPEETPYATKEDAESVLQDRYMKVMAAMSMGMMSEPPQWEIMDIDVPIVTKRVVMINGVLEEPKEFPMGEFPYTVNFAYFDDGEYFSVVDRLKDPQRFYNRMHSQIDYWIGTMAKGLIRVDNREDDETVNEVQEKWGKTGGVIKTKYKPEQIESRGPAPQLFSELDRTEKTIEDTLGGANILGQKETASESGRAVLARQAQAGLDNFVTMDNLRRTKQLLGSKIAWLLTNEITTPRKFRIMGDQLSMKAMAEGGVVEPSQRPNVGYLTVNTQPQNTIQGLEVDIVVDEAKHSVTHNQAILNSLVDAFKSGMIAVPPPLPVVLGLMSIPNEYKQLWEASAQPKKEDPMKISGNFKDLPPQTKLAILQEMGLPATLEQIGRKEVFDKLQPEKPEKKSDKNKG